MHSEQQHYNLFCTVVVNVYTPTLLISHSNQVKAYLLHFVRAELFTQRERHECRVCLLTLHFNDLVMSIMSLAAEKRKIIDLCINKSVLLLSHTKSNTLKLSPQKKSSKMKCLFYFLRFVSKPTVTDISLY